MTVSPRPLCQVVTKKPVRRGRSHLTCHGLALETQSLDDLSETISSNKTNNDVSVPVSTTDIVDTFLKHPDMLKAGDIVMFPYWEKITVAQSNRRIQPLLKLAVDMEVIVSGTGRQGQERIRGVGRECCHLPKRLLSAGGARVMELLLLCSVRHPIQGGADR